MRERRLNGISRYAVSDMTSNMEIPMTEQTEPSAEPKPVRPAVQKLLPEEIGRVRGPEPTRYGDWEHKGRCADF